jgi:hypothetical protein
MLHEYHVMYSVPYYPRFDVTAVGHGTYYPWIWEQYCTLVSTEVIRRNGPKRKAGGQT